MERSTTIAPYNTAYPIIALLGVETLVNIPPCAIDNGLSLVSNKKTVILRYIESTGKTRLMIIPILTRVTFSITAPNCSIKPPIKDAPYMIIETIPAFKVVMRVLNNNPNRNQNKWLNRKHTYSFHHLHGT